MTVPEVRMPPGVFASLPEAERELVTRVAWRLAHEECDEDLLERLNARVFMRGDLVRRDGTLGRGAMLVLFGTLLALDEFGLRADARCRWILSLLDVVERLEER